VSWRNDEALRQRLVEAAREKPRWGVPAIAVEAGGAGHAREPQEGVSRVYWEAGLLIRRKRRKRLLRAGFVRLVVTRANQEWALDFVHDAAESGRKFRVLSVLDVYTWECLALEVDTSFASRRVKRELDRNLRAGFFCPRGWSGRSRWCTSNRDGRCRIRLWKASTESCGMSA